MIEYFKKIVAMANILDSAITKDSDIDAVCSGIEEYTVVIYTVAFASGVLTGMGVFAAMVAFL